MDTLRLLPGAIHLWHLDLADPDWDAFADVLDATESERALRQPGGRPPQLFARSRAALRCILSSYIDALPHDVSFRSNAFGKPALLQRGPYFSLARSQETAVVAVATTPLGIDLEWVGDGPDEVHLMTDLFLHTAERAALDMRAGDLRQQVDRAWVGKEAYLKWLGVGSRRPLWSFRIEPSVPGQPPRIEDLAHPDLPRTYVHPVPVQSGFLSFVCTTVSAPALQPRFAVPASWLDLLTASGAGHRRARLPDGGVPAPGRTPCAGLPLTARWGLPPTLHT